MRAPSSTDIRERRTTSAIFTVQKQIEVSKLAQHEGGVDKCSTITTANNRSTTKPTQGCSFNKKRTLCTVHDCGTKVSKVTSKNWGFIKSKKSYGWISRKVSKVMCLGVRGEFRTQLDDKSIVSPNSSSPGEGREVGRFLELSKASDLAIGDLTEIYGEAEFDNNE